MKKKLLGKYCKVRNGFAFKSSEFKEYGIPIVRIGEIYNNNIDLSNAAKITENDKYNQFIINYDDILIAMSGATTGKIGVFRHHQKAYQNQRVGCFVPNIKILYPNYLYFVLKSLQNVVMQKAYGGGQPNISPNKIESIKIPIPENYDDQIRIATILSRAENLIAKRKESIELLDEFLKSTFLEMFGPSAKDYSTWPTREIQELANKKKGSMRTGPFGSNLLHSEFTPQGDVAVLGIDNAVNNIFQWKARRYITFKKYNTLKNYTIYPRDVIITIMGTTGRSAVVPKNIPIAINTKHLAAITFNTKIVNPEFISFSIHSNPFIKNQLLTRNRGAIMSGLNLGIIKKLKIHCPPIELQNKFEFFLNKINNIKSKYKQSLTEFENLYGSLSQRAFKGELDLSKIPIKKYIDGRAGVALSVKADFKVQKLFSKKELLSIIKSRNGNFFNFNELWDDLEKADFKEMPTYDEIKDMVFMMLEDKEPILSQSLDKDRKEIVLKGI